MHVIALSLISNCLAVAWVIIPMCMTFSWLIRWASSVAERLTVFAVTLSRGMLFTPHKVVHTLCHVILTQNYPFLITLFC